ncbi:MAG TPA: monovalent cation/H(+) antiporter subunit G [Usitatibacter sp.]|nr:monovalent cation/H(+) antiporter subunit G [Usitatibacter sp.]
MSAAAAVLALVGAAFAFVGAIGLLRMGTFFERVHPPTMGTTFGLGLVLAGSALASWLRDGSLPWLEILVALFMFVTTPVTYMLLSRAAMHRDGPGEEPRA